MLRIMATFRRAEPSIYLACWLRTTASSPWPSPPEEERETVARLLSAETRVRSSADGAPAAGPGYAERAAFHPQGLPRKRAEAVIAGIKPRILVIGCGSIGERHLRCFQRTGRAELFAC